MDGKNPFDPKSLPENNHTPFCYVRVERLLEVEAPRVLRSFWPHTVKLFALGERRGVEGEDRELDVIKLAGFSKLPNPKGGIYLPTTVHPRILRRKIIFTVVKAQMH